MYKHILLPVELGGPEDYGSAYDVASRLLEEGGKLTLLNAVEPLPSYAEAYLPADIQMQSREDAQDKLKGLANRLGVSNTALVYGPSGRSIVNWAEENDADCIVMASHRPVFSDLFLGSTAAWVVRHAKNSVHVLR